MRLLLNIAFYVQGLPTKELVLYIVLCGFPVCCVFFLQTFIGPFTVSSVL